MVFLPADGGASWLLLPIPVSLLLGNTVQPEKTYSVFSTLAKEAPSSRAVRLTLLETNILFQCLKSFSVLRVI